MTFIKVLPEAGGLKCGLRLWKHIFTDFRIPTSANQLFEFVSTDKIWLLLASFGVLLMLGVSCLQTKYQVRDLFNKLPISVRIVVVSCGMIIVAVFGGMALYNFGGGGFMYAGF